MWLLADDTTLVLQDKSQPCNAFGACLLVTTRSVRGELHRLRADHAAVLHDAKTTCTRARHNAQAGLLAASQVQKRFIFYRYARLSLTLPKAQSTSLARCLHCYQAAHCATDNRFRRDGPTPDTRDGLCAVVPRLRHTNTPVIALSTP